jgi:hypothetical protein
MRESLISDAAAIDVGSSDPESRRERAEVEELLAVRGHLEEELAARGIPVEWKESVALLHPGGVLGDGLGGERSGIYGGRKKYRGREEHGC